MTRPIKFRAWDKMSKNLFNVDVLEWSKGRKIDGSDKDLIYLRGNKPQNFEIQSCAEDKIDDRFILMQFTGLYDKSGKEIYERDIIRCYSKSGDFVVYDHEVKLLDFYREIWSNKKLDDDIQVPAESGQRCDFVEVIGNMFENPELIK